MQELPPTDIFSLRKKLSLHNDFDKIILSIYRQIHKSNTF